MQIMADPINVHEAPCELLIQIRGIGMAREQKIITARGDDGTALTMQKLVEVTDIGQTEWSEKYRAGEVLFNFPKSEIQVQGESEIVAVGCQ